MISVRTTTTRRRALAALALPVAATASCGSEAGTVGASVASGPAASDEQDPGEPGTLLDVRTPQEFAEGHLEGAVNIDITGETFVEQIEALDHDARYTLYCRSGNRSAQAKNRMEELGFTDVHDAGGVEQAAETLGLPVVTD